MGPSRLGRVGEDQNQVDGGPRIHATLRPSIGGCETKTRLSHALPRRVARENLILSPAKRRSLDGDYGSGCPFTPASSIRTAGPGPPGGPIAKLTTQRSVFLPNARLEAQSRPSAAVAIVVTAPPGDTLTIVLWAMTQAQTFPCTSNVMPSTASNARPSARRDESPALPSGLIAMRKSRPFSVLPTTSSFC